MKRTFSKIRRKSSSVYHFQAFEMEYQDEKKRKLIVAGSGK
jgi:hypothetical protein